VKQIMTMAMLGLLGLILTACIVEGPGGGRGGGYHEGYDRHESFRGDGDRDQHHDWR
jgi:hypothetical protein